MRARTKFLIHEARGGVWTVCRQSGTCKITRGSDTIATISWLGGFKQLAERVDYGELNTGTSVPESMTGRLVKPNPCQTSSGQI